MNDKKYNVFDYPLHEVTTENIRLSAEDKKKYKENLKEVLESIIAQMKIDETFKCLFRNTEYAGSSYENLKISMPNEFDIDLTFVWPAHSYQIVYDAQQPGYVKLKINIDDPALKKMRTNEPNFDKKLSKWIDKNGFFLRSQFRSWMQGMVDKTLKNVSVENTEIKASSSGPAITLKIYQQSKQLKYSVDLVPAFLCTENDWPKHPVRQLHTGANSKEWCVVPKEPKSENAPIYWRMSFYRQEKELMNNRLAMKHIIKLIKLLRDKENWSTDLYSYAIKTVFLWECEQTDIDFWQKGLGNLFVYMLRKLSDDYLTNGVIPHYWDVKLNLIQKMTKDAMVNLNSRIRKILKAIETNLDDPYAIKVYFGCTPEKVQRSPGEESSNSNISLIDLDIDVSDFPLSNSSEINLPRSQCPSECETKPETVKMNIDVGSNNKKASGLSFEKDSTSTVELLSMMLKEQHEIKQVLQSMSEQYSEVFKDVKVLRQEMAHLRELFQSNTNKNTILKTPSPVDNVLALSNLQISDSSNRQTFFCSGSQSTANLQNFSGVLNTSANKTPVSTGTANIGSFSDLLPPDFAKQPKPSDQSLELL